MNILRYDTIPFNGNIIINCLITWGKWCGMKTRNTRVMIYQLGNNMGNLKGGTDPSFVVLF